MQRWLNISNFLVKDGFSIHVYTPELDDFPNHDSNLVKEVSDKIRVIKRPIWEPYTLARKLLDFKANKHSGFISKAKKSWKSQLATWIRGNFFIPDARKFWIKPSVRFLNKYIKDQEIDMVISTGPPHSMHRIAQKLKRSVPSIEWIADFRDPWSNSEYFDELLLSRWAKNKHLRLEKEILSRADKVVTVSENWADEFMKLSNRDDIVTIRNGFNPDEFKDIKHATSPTKKITLSHIGNLGSERSYKWFWGFMEELDSQKYGIILLGNIDNSIDHSIRENQLQALIEIRPFGPRKEAMHLMAQSDWFLMFINDKDNALGRIPLKFYEYIASKKKVICVGPDRPLEVRNLIEKYGLGYYLTEATISRLKNILEENDSQILTDVSTFSFETSANHFKELIVSNSE